MFCTSPNVREYEAEKREERRNAPPREPAPPVYPVPHERAEHRGHAEHEEPEEEAVPADAGAPVRVAAVEPRAAVAGGVRDEPVRRALVPELVVAPAGVVRGQGRRAVHELAGVVGGVAAVVEFAVGRVCQIRRERGGERREW